MKMQKGITLTIVLVLILVVACAGAEDASYDQDIDALLNELKDASAEHIIWEPEVLEVEETRTILNPVYTTPNDSDLAQEEALRGALDTVFRFTDRTIDDIYNAYQIKFYFNTTPNGAERYWTILFTIGEGKMGGDDYVVEVASPDGTVQRYEIVTT